MVNLLGFFRKRKNEQENERIPQINVHIERMKEGLSFTLYREGTDVPLTLPFQLSVREILQQESLEQIQLIEDLWYDEKLIQQGDRYLLSLAVFSELEEEEKDLLKIPSPTQLDLKLTHEGAVGTPHFRLILEKGLGKWQHIERTAKQVGPWITLVDQTIVLMGKDQYQFQQLLDHAPDPKDPDKIFSFIAQVRSEANKRNIPLDNYLEKQEYLFVDKLELNVAYNQEEIQLVPKYRSDDAVPEQLLDEMSNTSSIYANGPHKEKIFVKPDIQDQAEKIRRIPPITGGDIPKFVENPEAFLPEFDGLDLENFGERVKSLGIRVYKAQPFVYAKEKERGWFDLDIGFSAVDDTGESYGTFQSNDFMDLVRDAKEEGNEYVQWGDQWVKIPQDADDFFDSTVQLNKELQGENRVDLSRLPYILEIFENISQLEFNQPILEAQRQMQDLGVLDFEPPRWFKAMLKPFQKDGFVWMKGLHFRKMGGLLADDMGLGKTIQVVSFLSYLYDRDLLTPTIIVVPKTLIGNWVKEINKFAPKLSSRIYVHQDTTRYNDPSIIQRYGITLTTYHTLVRDQLVLGQIDWKAVICDEAQQMKNPSTAVSHVVKALKSQFRLALTGTPVENSLSELWSIMDYVQPGILGSLKEFKQTYVIPLEENLDQEVETKLLTRIARFYKRRTKSEELADQIPKKNLIIREVPLGREQQEMYKEIVGMVGKGGMKGLEAIQKLRALTSHPGLIEDMYVNLPVAHVPKLEETLKILESVREKGEKALIFTEFKKMQKILRKFIMEQFMIDPMVINGESNRRQEAVDLFNQKSGFDVLILSPKAAGTGLTITGANHVIHYTRWWNPAVENQATDRVYRIGQDKPVYVYLPIVIDENGTFRKGTVEQIVHGILQEKQELATSVIIPSKKVKIEEEVLREMFVH